MLECGYGPTQSYAMVAGPLVSAFARALLFVAYIYIYVYAYTYTYIYMYIYRYRYRVVFIIAGGGGTRYRPQHTKRILYV